MANKMSAKNHLPQQWYQSALLCYFIRFAKVMRILTDTGSNATDHTSFRMWGLTYLCLNFSLCKVGIIMVTQRCRAILDAKAYTC